MDQYRRVRKELGRSVLGFGYAKEWPASWKGPADVDSGPVIPGLEISAGSSGLAFVGTWVFDDRACFRSLQTMLACAGFPHQRDGRLRYCEQPGGRRRGAVRRGARSTMGRGSEENRGGINAMRGNWRNWISRSSPRRLITPNGFLRVAALVAVVYPGCHWLGWREYASFLWEPGQGRTANYLFCSVWFTWWRTWASSWPRRSWLSQQGSSPSSCVSRQTARPSLV